MKKHCLLDSLVLKIHSISIEGIVILSFIVASAVSSCGLYTYVSLNPPLGFDDPSPNLLQLNHDLTNDDGDDQAFRGYVIFYRAYGGTAAAQQDIVDLNYSAGVYEDSPGNFVSHAEDLGFLRLRTFAADNPPLIEVSDTSPDVYYIELKKDVNWVLSTDSGSLSDDVVLARNIGTGYSTRYSFSVAANYQEGDADYEGSNAPSPIYFVFFAVAYGTDTASFTPVYSTPVIIDAPITYEP